MPKKLSVEVSDETYEWLCGLAGNFNLDVKQAAEAILISVGRCKSDIIQISELPRADKDLSSILLEALGNYPIVAGLFSNVLSKVKAEGKFTADIANVEINWENDFFNFHFEPATDDYNIFNLIIRKDDGVFCISTHTLVELENTKNDSFDDLRAAADSADYPFEVDECRIYVEDSVEDSCYLVIDCFDGSIDCLPSVAQVDKLIKKILKKAKVTL